MTSIDAPRVSVGSSSPTVSNSPMQLSSDLPCPREFLANALRRSRMFNSLFGSPTQQIASSAHAQMGAALPVPAAEFASLISSAKPQWILPGDTLMREGEPCPKSTTEVFVVQHGQLSVSRRKTRRKGWKERFKDTVTHKDDVADGNNHSTEDEEVRLGEAGPGEVLGELAVLYERPRSFTITNNSTEPALVWAIPSSAVQQLIEATRIGEQAATAVPASSIMSVSERLQHRRFLRRALESQSLFKSVDDPRAQESLISSFVPQHFKQGELIIRFGTHGDRFYTLEEGAAAVEVPAGNSRVSRDAPPGWVRVDTVGEGGAFGEVALLYSVPRSANVRCIAPECVTWSVDAQTFLEHSKCGSKRLRAVFDQFASARVRHGTHEEHLMTLADFIAAIRLTKGRAAWEDDDHLDSTHEPKQTWWNWLLETVVGQEYVTPGGVGQLSPHRLRLIFRLADTSGDKMLSFSEFLILHSLLSEPHSELQLAFRLFDSNKDGRIQRNEFIAAVRALAHDRGLVVDFDRDPLIVELFGSPVSGSAASESTAHTAGESTTPQTPEPTSRLGNWWRSATSLLRRTPQSNAHISTGNGHHTPNSAASYRSLSYEEFSALLKRPADQLPVYLREVQADFRAIDRYWSGGDVGMSLASGLDDGFGAASSVNLERLASNTLQTVTGQHVADSERLLARIPWKSLVAGGIAGAVSRSLVAPFERLKMLLQTQGTGASDRYTGVRQGLQRMKQEGGVRGMWSGNLANVLRIAPTLALQFAFYDYFVHAIFGPSADDAIVLQRIVAGACAGMTACLITFPLETVRTRLTLQRGATEGYSGITDAFRTIYRVEGVRGFYRGVVPSMLGVVPYVGFDFGVYESLKHALPRNERGEPGRGALFACGAVAGVVGQTVAYPLDVVRRRIQVYGWTGADLSYTFNYHQRTVMDAFRAIIKQDGYRGLYRGIGVNYIKVVPAVSVAFATYERVRQALDQKEEL